MSSDTYLEQEPLLRVDRTCFGRPNAETDIVEQVCVRNETSATGSEWRGTSWSPTKRRDFVDRIPSTNVESMEGIQERDPGPAPRGTTKLDRTQRARALRQGGYCGRFFNSSKALRNGTDRTALQNECRGKRGTKGRTQPIS